jgi:hypothetical protein
MSYLCKWSSLSLSVLFESPAEIFEHCPTANLQTKIEKKNWKKKNLPPTIAVQLNPKLKAKNFNFFPEVLGKNIFKIAPRFDITYFASSDLPLNDHNQLIDNF